MALDRLPLGFDQVLTEVRRSFGELLIVHAFLPRIPAGVSFEAFLEGVEIRPEREEIGLYFDLVQARATLALESMFAFRMHHRSTDSYWLEFRVGERRTLEIWPGTRGMLGLGGSRFADVR